MYFLIHKQGMRYILHNEIPLVAHTQQGIKNAYLDKGLFVTWGKKCILRERYVCNI